VSNFELSLALLPYFDVTQVLLGASESIAAHHVPIGFRDLQLDSFVY
jgi:hypothetical protein